MLCVKRIITLSFCAVLIGGLALPALRLFQMNAPDGLLYGYTPAVPPRPANLVKAFFDRSFQQWFEKYFEFNLGFRSLLIRSFNEINFRLFSESAKLNVLSTPEHGLYALVHIGSLNDAVMRRELLENRYRLEAQRLRQIQDDILSRGKYFVVVLATSKPYIYLRELDKRYLVEDSNRIVVQGASFRDALRDAGVNVVDSGPILREVVANTGIETHPASGLHWNYYAGCIAAKALLDDVRINRFHQTPRLGCGPPVLAEPHMTDVDGLRLLNIWSSGGIAKPTPYPTPVAVGDVTWRPKVLFVGDSYSEHMTSALSKADVLARLIVSNYFRTRESNDPIEGNIAGDDKNNTETAIRNELIRDIENVDVIVLEMVDFNVGRWAHSAFPYVLSYKDDQQEMSFGFTDYLLRRSSGTGSDR